MNKWKPESNIFNLPLVYGNDYPQRKIIKSELLKIIAKQTAQLCTIFYSNNWFISLNNWFFGGRSLGGHKCPVVEGFIAFTESFNSILFSKKIINHNT